MYVLLKLLSWFVKQSSKSRLAGMMPSASVISLAIFLSFVAVPTVGQQSGRGGPSVSINQQTTEFGTYHALIIGINEYRDWPPLEYAEGDASSIRQILVSQYGFDSGNVHSLLGPQATRSEILAELRSLFNGLREQDNLLIYYAGHGFLDTLTETGYWVPVDGKLDDESTLIAFTRIKTFLTARNVLIKNIMVITDSCYGGALARSGPTPGKPKPSDVGYERSLSELAAKRSRQVIASGGYEQVPDRSDFADLLKQALRTNPYERVDLEYLFFSEVYPKLRMAGLQYPQMARLVSRPGEDGQFVLLRSGSAESAARSAVTTPPSSLSRGDLPLLAEIEFWTSIKNSNDADLFQEYLRMFPNGTFALIAKKQLEGSPTEPVITRSPDVTSPVEPSAVPPNRVVGNTPDVSSETELDEPVPQISEEQPQGEVAAWSMLIGATSSEEMIQLGKDFLAQYPESTLVPHVHKLLAFSYRQMNDYENLILHAEKTLEGRPEDLDIQSALALAFAERGEDDRAIELAQQTLEILRKLERPQDTPIDQWTVYTNRVMADTHYAQGLAYLTKALAPEGDTTLVRRSIEYLEKAVNLDPSFHVAYFRLGHAYNTLNDAEKTIQSYARAVATDGVASSLAREQLQNIFEVLGRDPQSIDQIILEERRYIQRRMAGAEEESEIPANRPTLHPKAL